MTPPRLTATGIDKRFPGVVALSGVSLTLAPGEVLAVVGENGAGKSTLMKVVAGVYHADAGEVKLDGQPVRFAGPAAAYHADAGEVKLDGQPARFAGPADAMRAGVSLIHQELNLAENLTVADN